VEIAVDAHKELDGLMALPLALFPCRALNSSKQQSAEYKDAVIGFSPVKVADRSRHPQGGTGLLAMTVCSSA
jgi:hypothetical protein